jgi:hypothetical protein
VLMRSDEEAEMIQVRSDRGLKRPELALSATKEKRGGVGETWMHDGQRGEKREGQRERRRGRSGPRSLPLLGPGLGFLSRKSFWERHQHALALQGSLGGVP